MSLQEIETIGVKEEKAITVPHDVYMNKRLFQKWFLADYLERFEELPELLIPIRNSLLNDDKADKEKYFSKVCEAVSLAMFGRDETFRMFDKSRTRETVSMRKVVCYILVKKLKFPITTVAKMIAKNHATIIYLCRCTENHLEFDKDFQKSFIEIENHLLKLGIVWQ